MFTPHGKHFAIVALEIASMVLSTAMCVVILIFAYLDITMDSEEYSKLNKVHAA
jgi:hypothetical protein